MINLQVADNSGAKKAPLKSNFVSRQQLSSVSALNTKSAEKQSNK